MKFTSTALTLVQTNQITIYTHGSLFDQAMVTYLLARCLFAEAETAIKLTDSKEFKARTGEIFQLLSRAKKMFMDIEAFHHVKAVVLIEAHLYHRLGYVKERNTRAMRFRQLDEQYPSKSSGNVLIYIGL